MNISWLTLRDLEYVVALSRVHHFGKAAASCHVSQPTLSAQIKKIEDLLGLALFERSNKRVDITQAGQRVAEQARVVLEEAQKIPKMAQGQQKPLSGRLSLGSIATLGPYFVPDFLGPLRDEYPELRLALKEGLTESLLNDLREGRLDVVMAARTFDEKGFHVIPLFFEPFVLAMPKGHALEKKHNMSPSDLRAEEMILLEEGHCLRDQAIDSCPASRRGNIQQFHATSTETLSHLVASGFGYTLLPKLAVKDSPLKRLVTYRPFTQESVGREIVLVCRKHYHAMNDVEHLARFLTKCAVLSDRLQSKGVKAKK